MGLAGTGPSLEPGRKGMSEEQEEYTATEPCRALLMFFMCKLTMKISSSKVLTVKIK